MSRPVAGLVTFFLVAFGGSGLGWLLVTDETLRLWLPALFASLAGFAAALAEGGFGGLRAFAGRVLAVNLRSVLYALLGIAIPLVLGLAFLFSTGVPLSAMDGSPLAILGLTLGAALVSGPLAEEFGWRGYLQPKLLGRFTPFTAALLIGVVWCVWHLPLYGAAVFGSPATALRFLAYLVVWSLFMAVLVQRAGGAVWPAVAFHWAANTHADVLRVLFPSVDGGLLPGGSKSTLFYAGAAVLFVILNRKFFFTRPVTGQAGDAAVPAAEPSSVA
ncbi:CPBP family intramembrane glutamic endopeptidase [Caulobacter sp. 17J80-11]|uniref:CPBP family intramembrane glutamic endopeptidase n=1 Tax=Caulobacter sp. 17J80-11 TaxID=2763502 RepID=UPI001653D694|nr:type II CAAX endopeptidase family protein [Caulobacter sp. 17J80-11]MBC6983370.1 CPBP family intramembrane metalloprotease [Caulobacter sp. 17J80-11]